MQLGFFVEDALAPCYFEDERNDSCTPFERSPVTLCCVFGSVLVFDARESTQAWRGDSNDLDFAFRFLIFLIFSLCRIIRTPHACIAANR